MHAVTHDAPTVFPTARAGHPWWAGPARTVAEERRVRRARRELAELSARELRDIGLDRGELEHAARHGRGFSHSRLLFHLGAE